MHELLAEEDIEQCRRDQELVDLRLQEKSDIAIDIAVFLLRGSPLTMTTSHVFNVTASSSRAPRREEAVITVFSISLWIGSELWLLEYACS